MSDFSCMAKVAGKCDLNMEETRVLLLIVNWLRFPEAEPFQYISFRMKNRAINIYPRSNESKKRPSFCQRRA